MYRMMIIDDERMIHLSIRKLVETSGLPVVIAGEAEDGAEALNLLESVNPDIIVTDICMPEMDGLAFIQRAKDNRKSIHFIILTGHERFEFAQQALRYGVRDFLLKPVNPDQFIESLQQVCSLLSDGEGRLLLQKEWLRRQQEMVKNLTEQIWSANEEAAGAAIEEVVEHYRNPGSDEYSAAQFAKDLLREVESELQRRHFELSHTYAGEGQWPVEDQASFDRMRDAVKGMIDEIKGSRNLGSRNNILKAVKYIGEHYAREELSLKDVADSLGMSVPYLSRSFKEEMDINFVKYLIGVRMEKAKLLLEQGECPTTEAAYQAGFSDYSHFSKTFKKHYGLTPSDFRKQHQRQST
ncbi:response regulator [Paenibacillus nasutitermitis]|uniref:Response regulator n=1 Tax=Paenibacillus nasutitermitis TaxID=1652958 RepID=A0A916YL83_9BACL|nr:response regulator [Paenibacillus nasutitermitis]GGD50189.1 hypothetical protein GCM10010911_04710 [Paenibacillus nasutitermitis]